MEAVASPVPLRAHVKDLLSPELRVPRHEPDLHASQPSEPLFVGAARSPTEVKLDSPRVSTIQVVPVDSVQNSLHRDESQTQAPPSQASPLVVPRDNLDPLADSIATQAVAATESQVQESGVQREDESETTADLDIIPYPTLRGHTAIGEITIEIPKDDDGQSGHTESQEIVHETGVDQGRPLPSQEGLDQTEHRAEQSPATIGRPPVAQSGQPDSQSHTTVSRQPYLKLFFWKRYRSSRNKQSSKKKAVTAGAQEAVASATTSPQHAQPEPIRSTIGSIHSSLMSPESSTSPDTLSVHTVTVSVDSPNLYRLDNGTYIGKLRWLPPPATVEATWSSTTRKRLITDLRPVLASLPKSLPRDETIIELELCMSGRIDAASNQVILSPSIWIRCGSKRCRDEIQKAVADLSYLRAFQVHFRLDAPRFACRSTRCSSIVARQATDTPSPSGRGGLSSGSIAGIAVGSVAVLGFVALVALYCLRRRKHKKLEPEFLYPPPAMSVYPEGLYPSGQDPTKFPPTQPTLPPMTDFRESDGIWSSNGQPLDQPIFWPTVEAPGHVASRYMRDPMTGSTEVGSSPGSYINARTELSTSRPDYSGAFHSVPAHVEEDIIFEEETRISNSACGLQVEFEVSDGGVKHVAASTIGGLIRINGIVYGLTTAHSIFDLLPAYDRSQRYTTTYQDRHAIALNVNIPGRATTRFKSNYLQMRSELKLRAMGYGNRYLWPDSVLMPLPIMSSFKTNSAFYESDFALVEVSESIKPCNTYQPIIPGSRTRKPSLKCSVRNVSFTLHSGNVSIILSELETRSGFLLQRSALFMDRSGIFETRKIHTEEKLGKGSSGAWVVRGSDLLGVIVAVYDNEPYAHMLPIEQVFSAIRSAYTDGTTNPANVDISLPPVDPTAMTAADM